MRTTASLITLVILLGLSGPSLADGKKDKSARHSGNHEAGNHEAGNHEAGWNCPPGLAKKNPPCVPPGQAKKRNAGEDHDGYHDVGHTLPIRDYILIRDPGAYGLDPRAGWDYYRDDQQIYGIDPATRRILAIVELVEAFSN